MSRFWSFFVGVLCLSVFAVGIFLVVYPLMRPAEAAEPEPSELTTANIGAYINEFAVDTSPWIPSDGVERVQVGITNIGGNTYDWVVLDVVFLDDNGVAKSRVQSGAHSQIIPGDTVNVYMAAAGTENARGFVSRVQANIFTDMGIV